MTNLHDAYKWVLDIEIEDIPEVIEELEEEIYGLEESIKEFDGAPILFQKFLRDRNELISYKRQCIIILDNIAKEENENE